MANKIYTLVEELITFQDSGGSAVITLQNLAFGAGRLSARYDRGTGAKPGWARLWAVVQFETAAVVGETVEIYVVPWSSHGTPLSAGGLGTADAALTSDQRRNLNNFIPNLLLIVDKTSTATNIVAQAPLIYIPGRYVSVAVWNASAGDNLENTANANQISLEFVPQEVQNNA